MPDFTAERRLVKSPPELWAELSEVDRLAKHLEAFGEIRITKLEPENSLDWEGDSVRGSVFIEPSGWGTKVKLTAALPDAPEPEPEPEPELTLEHVLPEPPEPEPALPPPRSRRGLLARLFGGRWRRRHEEPEPSPVAKVQPPPPDPEPPPQPPPPEPEQSLDSEAAQAALDGMLDTLGAAHHRPFSRG